MKTILIAHNYSEISFAAMSYHLAHHLADLGYKVIFISHNPYFSEKQLIQKKNNTITIYSWPTKKRPTSLKDFVWFSKLYLQYKPDVIIGHFVGSNITIMASKLLSFGKVKTIEYYHTLTNQLLADHRNTDLKQSFLFLRKKIFYKLFCDVLVCPSDLAKKDLEQFYSIQKGQVILNPMLDRFTNTVRIPKEYIVIAYLGRLDKSKGVLDLIQAYKGYKGENNNSKIVLKIAGGGTEEVEIKELIKDIPGIHFVGGLPYDTIDAYLSGSHFTIIPSKFDAFNVVGIESMMNQTPLLISTKTGLTDYLTDGKECFKFDPNVDSIIALFYRVENNFGCQEQMSIEARATFLEKFSVETYCTTFLELII